MTEGPSEVDVAIAALADPTRRRVVELLLERPRRTGELADDLGITVPAVSRHLRTLRQRGLIERSDVEGDGRGRRYRLEPGRLEVLASWLGGRHWATTLPAAPAGPGDARWLARVGGFLDAFASGDTAFFVTHLADDASLWFPGSQRRWDKPSTIETVAGHSPYVDWSIGWSTVTALAPGLTLVTIEVSVRTAAQASSTTVIQSMIFDDTAEPWTLRFLQQTPTDGASEHTPS